MEWKCGFIEFHPFSLETIILNTLTRFLFVDGKVIVEMKSSPCKPCSETFKRAGYTKLNLEFY